MQWEQGKFKIIHIDDYIIFNSLVILNLFLFVITNQDVYHMCNKNKLHSPLEIMPPPFWGRHVVFVLSICLSQKFVRCNSSGAFKNGIPSNIACLFISILLHHFDLIILEVIAIFVFEYFVNMRKRERHIFLSKTTCNLFLEFKSGHLLLVLLYINVDYVKLAFYRNIQGISQNRSHDIHMWSQILLLWNKPVH